MGTPAICRRHGSGQVDVVNRLLDLPDLEINTINNQTFYDAPLFLAAGLPGTDMLDLFLQRDMDKVHREQHIYPPLFNAILAGNRAAAQAIVDAGGGDEIAMSAWIGLAHMIYDLLEQPRQSRIARIMNHYAPQLADYLWYFIYTLTNGLEIIDHLLDSEPDMSGPGFLSTCRIVARNTVVAEDRKLDLLKRIIACGAKPFADSGYPALLQVIVSNKCKGALSMVEYICSLPGCPSPSTAIGFAQRVEVAKFLLDKGADVNARDETKDTSPLLLMLNKIVLYRYNYERDMELQREMIALLLEHGADASYVDAEGRNAIQLAARGYADEQVIEMLFDHGAKVVPASAEDQPAFQHSLNNSWDIMRERRGPIVRLLLDRGAAVNVPDSHGRTALWAACFAADAEALKMFLEAGADVKMGDAGPVPLLHLASDVADNPGVIITAEEYKASLLDITRMLLDAGATMWRYDGVWPGAFGPKHLQLYLDHGLDINDAILWERTWMFQPYIRSDTTIRTGTLLHYAIESHDIDYINYVLDAGADPSLTNVYGQTPWDTARRIYGTRHVDGKLDPFVEMVKATAVYTKRETGLGKESLEWTSDGLRPFHLGQD